MTFVYYINGIEVSREEFGLYLEKLLNIPAKDATVKYEKDATANWLNLQQAISVDPKTNTAILVS